MKKWVLAVIICCDIGYANDVDRAAEAYELGDYKKAFEYSQNACKNGEGAGCSGVGFLHQEGLGVPQNYKKASEFYEIACEKNDALGCYNLGFFYANQLAGKLSYSLASKYYQKACDGGYANSCNALGNLYIDGRGVPQDNVQATAYYKKACDQDGASGCYNLGISYENGQGIKQDIKKAAASYKKACELGEDTACENYEITRSQHSDQAVNAQQLTEDCDNNSAQACRSLAILYEYGEGVQDDHAKAVELYKKACELNDEWSCKLLRSVN